MAGWADEILVGGQWRRGCGPLIESVDPATGAVVHRFHGAGLEDVDAAVAAGLAAAQDPAWRNLLAHQRAAVLRRIGTEIEASADLISAVQTADTGKVRAETRALAMSAAGTFVYTAAALETMEEPVTPARGGYLTMGAHEPYGVVAAITPWNSPIASEAQKVAPALAAGNAVVLKSPLWAPCVSLLLGRICQEAGLPAGLLSVLPGSGAVVGDALVRHPQVGKVSFTGGTTTGRSIGRAAADKVMPVTLELGGKSPTIVFPDADREQALAGILFGIFSSSGQSCIAGSRVFVHESIYDDFVSQLVQRTRALRVGPGDDPESQVGPLVHRDHRDKVRAMVERAKSEGAQVLCGGSSPEGEGYATGAYYLPTVLAGVANTDWICREEIFGPVAVVLPFGTEADLVAQANDSEYGLACGIWTADYRRAWRIAQAVQAGTVWINTYKQFSISTPFSGHKNSGLGTEKGREGIKSYMRQKSIYWETAGSPLPWAEHE
ncbi:aldehyde dehydrogenase [Leekyejoonella antrihumi]|uniref:Aldehyde dehydrogenase n=2 Tax=Leekyejoonella antrihumi TaxID=1660198 RepID=A0A563DXQ7_9MICO|nr:aldehyde dehydrogenase [Leekyejoonella antrihumi]